MSDVLSDVMSVVSAVSKKKMRNKLLIRGLNEMGFNFLLLNPS